MGSASIKWTKLTPNAAGTFTQQVNPTTAEGVGAGGGGGTGSVGGGGGGGGAAYALKTLTNSPGTAHGYIIPVATAGNGADTDLGTGPLLRADGGTRGVDGSAIGAGAGGPGGTVANSIGDTRTAGTAGQAGLNGGAAAPPMGGAGGTAPGASPGGNGTQPGGGGGGGGVLGGLGGLGAAGALRLSWDIDSAGPNAEWNCAVTYKVRITRAAQAEGFASKQMRIRQAGYAAQSEWFGTKILRARLDDSAQSEWFGTRTVRARIDQFTQSEWYPVRGPILLGFEENAQSEWFPAKSLLIVRSARTAFSEWFGSRVLRVRTDTNVQSEWNPVRAFRVRLSQLAFSEWFGAVTRLFRVDDLALSEWFGSFSRALVFLRSADVYSEWFGSSSRSIIYVRTANAQAEWNPQGRIEIPIDDIPAAGGPVDWPDNDELRAIAGTVLFHEPPNQGDPVEGAEVCLFRDSDGFLVGCVLTDINGDYTFPRGTTDPYTYHVEVNWTDGMVKQQGLSEGGCVPS